MQKYPGPPIHVRDHHLLATPSNDESNTFSTQEIVKGDVVRLSINWSIKLAELEKKGTIFTEEFMLGSSEGFWRIGADLKGKTSIGLYLHFVKGIEPKARVNLQYKYSVISFDSNTLYAFKESGIRKFGVNDIVGWPDMISTKVLKQHGESNLNLHAELILIQIKKIHEDNFPILGMEMGPLRSNHWKSETENNPGDVYLKMSDFNDMTHPINAHLLATRCKKINIRGLTDNFLKLKPLVENGLDYFHNFRKFLHSDTCQILTKTNSQDTMADFTKKSKLAVIAYELGCDDLIIECFKSMIKFSLDIHTASNIVDVWQDRRFIALLETKVKMPFFQQIQKFFIGNYRKIKDTTSFKTFSPTLGDFMLSILLDDDYPTNSMLQ